MIHAKSSVAISPRMAIRITATRICFATGLALLCGAQSVWAQRTGSSATDGAAREAQVRARADQLLGQMTLEEKTAQLSQLPGFPIPEFRANTNETMDQIIAFADVDRFLDTPVTWLPSTWIFKNGKLYFALNYGEIRFPVLQQLVDDSTTKWDRDSAIMK